MSRLGADVDALEGVAAELTAFAGRVDGTRGRVAAVLAGLRWTGTDAHGFRRAWDSGGSADLWLLGSELRTASQQLTVQAFQQRLASAADAGEVRHLLTGGARSLLAAAGIDPSRWRSRGGNGATGRMPVAGDVGAVDRQREDDRFRFLGGVIGAVRQGEGIGESLADGSKTLFGTALKLTGGREEHLPWGGAREGLVGGAGAVLSLAATGITSGFSRYQRDARLDLPPSERALRVGVDSGIHMAAGTLGAVGAKVVGAKVGAVTGVKAGGVGGAVLGGAVGAVIGGPVGAAVGAKAGAVVGAKFGGFMGGKLGAAGAGVAISEGVSRVMSSEPATAAVDHAVELASDVHRDVSAGVSALGEAASSAKSSAVDAVGGAVDSVKGFFR